MAESTLAIQLSDLAAEVGSYLGYGRITTAWSGWVAATPYVASTPGTQLGQIMACIQAGLRQFYFPKLSDAQAPVAHKWSFLTPERTLTVYSGLGVYDMPDDFAGLEGELTYQPTDSTYLTVQRMGIGQIQRFLQQYMGMTAKPTACAVYPKATDGVLGQRFSISFAPLPDATYTLTYCSNILPLALSATNPYPYGGAAHGETILESCLAIAESRINEDQGVHAQAFMERLQASITVDVRDFRPERFGYNADRSDAAEGAMPWSPWGTYQTQTTGATYNGVQYAMALAFLLPLIGGIV